MSGHYIESEIPLPRGNEMARGHIVAQSHNTDGNLMGRAHTNPILDIRVYQGEFALGDVTELTTNIIAKSM